LGDAAVLGGVRSTVTWRRQRGVAVSMSPPQLGPNVGNGWGTRRRRRWPRVVVVVVGDGGGSEKRWGTSQCVTRVTFQPRLLDLATHGRLLLINGK
jgi:hypothetical protein